MDRVDGPSDTNRTELSAKAAEAVAAFLNSWRAEQPDNPARESMFEELWSALQVRCPHPAQLDHGQLGETCTVCAALLSVTEICLGTLADLGVDGKEVRDACLTIQRHSDRLAIWCRVCHRKIVATIHGGMPPEPARRLALEGDPTICDSCFARESTEARTVTAG